jgi:hypothetical protein
VFDNKIYSPYIGIKFDSPAGQARSVFGNAIFAEIPIAGFVHGESGYPVSELSDPENRAASHR